MTYLSQYVRDLNHREGANDVATISADGRWGVLPDGTKLRNSEADLFPDILSIGDLITMPIPEGASDAVLEWHRRPRRVIGINAYTVYGMRTWSVTIVDPDAPRLKGGFYRETAKGWINELVVHEGRIRKLFAANEDEYLICEPGPTAAESPPVQARTQKTLDAFEAGR